MGKISDILQQLNTLPSGYISKKKIHGDIYYYFQYSENGKQYSKYIPRKDLLSYQSKISLRNKLKEELKAILNSGKAQPLLTKNARNLNGNVMMQNIVVASFDNGILTYLDEKRAPLSIIRNKDIKSFLSSRTIDDTRRNSRILKKLLMINVTDDNLLSLYAHGAVITDNYWFKTKGSRLNYEDIIFEQDIYHEVALDGILEIITSKPRVTPQITLGGSYEKCWRKIKNEWWIYKKGNTNELFSEMFSSRLAFYLNIPTVQYELIDNNIRCKNFATKYNFEPLSALIGENYNYETVFNALIKIKRSIAKQYLLLSWFDALVFNFDRHNDNCGLLRDKKTGEIVSLAPNFDNNLSLIAYNQNLKTENKDDAFLKNYIKFIKNNKTAKELFSEITLPKLSKEIIDKCLVDLVCPIDVNLLTNYLLNRYYHLTSFLK
ncbi:MAG: hypothetical protein MJ213_04975 [Bacilli bacterium]|nr:hypothetical protein [Bacilli bacterium]